MCGMIAHPMQDAAPTMKLTILAHTVLAVVAIAIAAASSPSPDLGTQPLEKISQDAHYATLAGKYRLLHSNL